MPRHQQVTTCRKSGGPISKFCSCEHCTLAVCTVCGAYEGGLTTDCPGATVNFDRQREVFETSLDYTDACGWHLDETTQRRSPRFTTMKPTCSSNPSKQAHTDPRAEIAPTIDWTVVDRNANIQHELAQKAIAWVIADRLCEDRAATLARVQDETARLRGKELTAEDRELLGKLESEKIDFRIACSWVEKCDNEFRQTARKLVASLEGSCVIPGDPAP